MTWVRFIVRYMFLALLFSIFVRPDLSGQIRQNIEQATRDYYSHWIGVKADEFSQLLTDRHDDGPELRLQDFQGKRLLLFAFDAGNFVDGPRDEKATLKQLADVHNLRQRHGANVAVIGFTYGPVFFMPGTEPPPELKKVTGFPIVNVNKLRHGPLQEPYNLLQRWPSLVAIDKQGIIIGIYSPPLTESNITQAFAIEDWAGNVRLPPGQEPPERVRNWSRMNFWVVFAYTKDLSSGSKFQREFGRMKRVYLEEEVPPDEVSGLKLLEGMTLRRNVKAGEAIRQSDFENR